MNLGEYTLYSPYFALTEKVADEKVAELLGRFAELPEESRELLTSEEVAQTVQSLIEDGTLLPKYRIATAKIVALVALGDVSPESVHELFIRLGVPQINATRATGILEDTLASLEVLRRIDVHPEPVSMEKAEMPALTRPTEAGPRPLSPQPPSRNIIDLRPPAGEAGKQRPTDA